jgi:AcrR family transcriptional regulator
MRHKGVEREKIRQKVINAAGRNFRKYGYAGIGVDSLAKSAGVTSGAIYSNFGSKNETFSIALATGLDEVIKGIHYFQHQYGIDWVNVFVEYYLSKPHRKNLENSCPLPTLTPEVVRFGPEIHTVYEKKIVTLVEIIMQGLAGDSYEDRRTRAWSLIGILIGGISVARAMESTNVSENVAKAIKLTAIKVAGPTCILVV